MKFDPNDTKNLLNVAGTWYLRAMVKGVRIKQTLRTDNLATAQRLRDERLAALVGREDEKALFASVERQLAGIEAEEKAVRDDVRSGLKLADLWKKFLDDPEKTKASPSTMRNYRHCWQVFLGWLAKKHPEIQYCRQLTRGIGKEFSIHLNSTTGSVSSYNTHIIMIRRVIETAVDLDEKVVNPMARLKALPVTDTVKKEIFTDAELKKIFADSDAEFVRLCAIGLYTTQRFDVARKMTWEMFTDDLGYLDVIHHKTGAPGSMRVPSPLKEILMRVPSEERHGFICPNYAVLNNSMSSHTFQMHLEEHGIKTQKEVERKPGHKRMACIKGFHSFRHTAITIAKRNCSNNAKIKRWAGHSTDKMSDYYTHLNEDDAGDAADTIGKFW